MVKKHKDSSASIPESSANDTQSQTDTSDDDGVTVLGLGTSTIETVLFCLTAALYLNSLKAKLVFDDDVAVVNNKARI